VATNKNYEWDRFGHWFTTDVIISGLWVTLEVTGWSALFGIVLGVLLAVARLSTNSLWRAVSWLYIWFFRSVPLILLLLILYNLPYFYPHIGIGIPFGPTFASGSTTDLLSSTMLMGVLGLGLNEAAYAAELVRGGILSVDHGQIEAATALGLSPARQLRRIILPQALRSIIPGYVNQIIGLIKSSSLVYYVSLLDIFSQVFLLESRFPTDVVPLLLVGAAWYLILTAVLSVVQYYVERFFARGAARTLPQTPWQKLRTFSRNAWTIVRDLRTRIAEESAR
jgi:polar amino acid transport system permease protein